MGIDLAFWLSGLTSGEETRDLKKLPAITSTLGFKVTKIREHSAKYHSKENNIARWKWKPI